jgi:Galactose oxidase, central domain
MPIADRPDLEERLRRLPAALVVDPPPGLLEGVVRQGRRRRRLRRAAAAAAIVVLATGVLATRAVVADRGAGQPLHPGRAGAATAAQLAGGRVRSLPPDPVVDRLATAATAWSDRELLVWGGATRDRRVHADGAAFDPATGRWRPLPPAPQAQQLDRRGAGAVWTGRELLVWGGTTPVGGDRADGSMRPGDGLAYDPARGAWRRLRPPPRSLPASAGPALWTGRELLVVDASGGRPVAGGGIGGAAYDPVADRWRQLAPSPRLGGGQLLERTVLWAGTRLLVWSFWTSRGGPAPTSADPDGVELWAYDPGGDRWTAAGPPSGPVRASLARASLAWAGREVLAVQNTTQIPPDPPLFGGRYDPGSDRWTPIAPPPQRVPFGVPGALVWTGAALVANGAAAYDPAADRWWRLPGTGGWRWAGGGPLVRPAGPGRLAMLVPEPD